MDYDKIHKIWGVRNRIHLGTRHEIDMLTLSKDSFCSSHYHNKKINKFHVISGEIIIETERGTILLKGGESFTVFPDLIHRFIAVENSVMLELAYVEESTIDPHDIVRLSQGGRIVNYKYLTEQELKEKGLLNFKYKGKK